MNLPFSPISRVYMRSLIKNTVSKKNRIKILIETVKEPSGTLNKMDYLKSKKKISDWIYTAVRHNQFSDFNQALQKDPAIDPNV